MSTLYQFLIINETDDPVLVSSIDIEDILDTVNWNHLDDVYIRLGLEYKDIQNERLATPDRRGQEKKILHLWCDTEAGGATRESMITAMEQVPKCTASLNRLKEKWNNRSPGKYDVMGTK